MPPEDDDFVPPGDDDFVPPDEDFDFVPPDLYGDSEGSFPAPEDLDIDQTIADIRSELKDNP